MKALVYRQYGTPDVLQYTDVEKPTPKENEVLVQIHAASLNAADGYLLQGKPLLVRAMQGFRKPKFPILGSDIAGRVVGVGSSVHELQVGEVVFGDLSASGWGGLAEYVCVPETALTPMPKNLSFAQAAAVPMAAVTALQGLRKFRAITAGQHILVNGASGGVGTYAVQLAKTWGARVTAVCSTRHVELLLSLGADDVIDYTKADFVQYGERYDVIIGANGYRSLSDYKRVLKPAGAYVCTGGTMRQIFASILVGPLMSIGSGQQMGNLSAKPNVEDLKQVKTLIETGHVKPIIDRCYRLNEGQAALRYLMSGHAKGKVVVVMEASEAHNQSEVQA